MAPEWLPERSHDSGCQSNAAVDIGLKAPVLMMMELVNKIDIIVADM